MSNTFTYAQVGTVLHDIGMVSTETLHRALERCADYANEEVDHYEAALALEHFGVAVSVHADDIDSIHDDYAPLLHRAAEVAGTKVAITNVRLVEGEGELKGGRIDTLTFERDGKPVSVNAEHFADDYYDHEAAWNAIGHTAHDDDPREWHLVRFEREAYRVYETILLFATPEQQQSLSERLGFRYF